VKWGAEDDRAKMLEGENMKWKFGFLSLGLLVVSLCVPATHAAPPTNPCSLLTLAQVGAALGGTVAAGTLAGSHDCEWAGAHGAPGKTLLVEIVGPIGSVTPAERFNTMKAPLPVRGIVKTPVNGIGDDAVYVTTNGTLLSVRKGGFVFTVHINGFSTEEAKAKEKTLALAVLAKL
jgi:hypothetical protein